MGAGLGWHAGILALIQTHCFEMESAMIYKFKSRAEGDVVMQESNGDQMLRIIGRQPAAQGIITVEQIPAAIAALEAAIAMHEAVASRTGGHVDAGYADTGASATGDGVRLRARATPFIELLRNSARVGKDVVWGV